MNKNFLEELKCEKNFWYKGHGLGNDYVVFDSENTTFPFDEEKIVTICNRNYGIGSDGILLKVPSNTADFGLRIFNPDGSEAEKSGNGLRIFAEFLYKMNYTQQKEFTISVNNEVIKCEIKDFIENGSIIKVDIGKANFNSDKIPVLCERPEAIDLEFSIDGQNYDFSMVSLGNPHAVCIIDNVCPEIAKKIGPVIENSDIFPNRINVQFAQIIDRKNVKIEIWERGAGYTLASGSSSCGVASVLYKKGLIDGEVTIHMPGGKLQIIIDEEFNLKLQGEVKSVSAGVLF